MMEDLQVLQGLVHRLGGVVIGEEEKHMPWVAQKASAESVGGGENDEDYDDIDENLLEKIYFTVEVQ